MIKKKKRDRERYEAGEILELDEFKIENWKRLPCCHHAKQHSAHAPRLFFDTG
jgi:hypothetical protein